MNYKINLEKLSTELLNKGYSINKLARLTGLSKSTVSKVMKGKSVARVETIFKIANILGLEAKALIVENE